jgi:hypothetical protein
VALNTITLTLNCGIVASNIRKTIPVLTKMKNKQKHTTLSQLRKNLELGEIDTLDTQLQALQ